MGAAQSVFEYRDYKEFLRKSFPVTGERRGRRSQLAAALRCQSAYVSQVLNGDPHFGLEHAIAIAGFLAMSKEESQFFLLLVQEARAGSEALKRHFSEQIQAVVSKRELVKNRIRANAGLKKERQIEYYKSWVPAAVHVAVSIPELRSADAIASRLSIPIQLVRETLEFLSEAGFVVQTEQGYRIGNSRIHLGTDSPLLSQHHTHWRMQAVQSLPRGSDRDLHYSSVISLSQSDRDKIRAILLNVIESTEPILRASSVESLFCLALDFFEL